uniref:ACT domain-containing protein ACR n=1 Tax=Aegilops tauschii subsp. strangulata TaxID=200361 RepID=A0A453GZ16_AEGTS
MSFADVTCVLCEMELTIRRVKVSTTPDGRVMDLFFITDARELLHTKSRREEAYEKLQSVLGDSVTSCEIESATEDMSSCLQASALLSPLVLEQMFSEVDVIEEQSSRSRSDSRLSVTMDNSLSPAHTLIQIQCGDHKGLLYDIMRTVKDCNIQVIQYIEVHFCFISLGDVFRLVCCQISYGRFYAGQKGRCEVDLFAVQSDGKKILDQQKQRTMCSRLRTELLRPLRVALVNRGPDAELLVANPVEVSGKGRPLVFYDITLALKNLHRRVFLAEIGRHVVDDREWEVYRVHLGEDDHELSCSVRSKIVDGVTNMLMGWD